MEPSGTGTYVLEEALGFKNANSRLAVQKDPVIRNDVITGIDLSKHDSVIDVVVRNISAGNGTDLEQSNTGGGGVGTGSIVVPLFVAFETGNTAVCDAVGRVFARWLANPFRISRQGKFHTIENYQ
jgi:hypothetical protein